MAKRFATVFFITLAIAVLGVAVFVLVLFMAPGMSVFGLKYIATNTHIIDKNLVLTQVLEDKYPGIEFSGSIRVEVDEVPVQVMFTQGRKYELWYYDNYSGLTMSKIQDPSITITKDDDGTAVIKVDSYKKFIYENGNSTRVLRLKIPAAAVDGVMGEPGAAGELGGLTNLTIISDSSSVKFYDEVADNFNPYFNKISIETSGKVTSSINLQTETFEYITPNSITIGSSTSKAINARNYVLESNGGNIKVERDVIGNLTATTKNASISILSCENLKASSGYGDIRCSDSEKDIIIRHKAEIETTAGIVTIGQILGQDCQSSITTKSGIVSVKKMYDGSITTTRGHVKVNSARNLTTKTSSGNIVVEESTSSVKIETKRGKVTVGGPESTVVSPSIKSDYGKVFVNSASGVVNIETTEANVEFTNDNASEIVMNIGGDLVAKNLRGAVNITVNGDATLSFKQFNQNSQITNIKEGSSMTINLLNETTNEFAYALVGTDVKLLGYNPDDPANSIQYATATEVFGGNEDCAKLTVTSKGSFVVYCERS